MERVHLIVDLAKCVGCFNCLMACKDEHVDNCWLPYTDKQMKHDEKWIDPIRHERGKAPYTDVCFVPKMCQHCEEAHCQKAQPDAVIRRDDGIVLLDPAKAQGNRALVDACPYGMISWNSELETAQKCTMCAHLLDNGWKEPRCVQACPLRALSIVKCEDAEFEQMIIDQALKPLNGGANKPMVLYKNLEKYTTNFISGALAYEEDGIEKAAEGAAVTLYLGDTLLKEVETDFFGEFKFDHIPPNTGNFRIECHLSGYAPLSAEVTMENESVCLDVMRFQAGAQ